MIILDKKIFSERLREAIEKARSNDFSQLDALQAILEKQKDVDVNILRFTEKSICFFMHSTPSKKSK